MKSVKLLVAAGAVAVALLVVPAAPAQANCATAYQGGSWATECDLHHVAVCDNDPDGHLTYARLWNWYTGHYYLSGYDSYGRDSAGQFCHHESTQGWGWFQFAVCVQNEGCSAWKRAV